MIEATSHPPAPGGDWAASVARGVWRDLTARRLLFLVVICFVISTELLANSTVIEDRSLAEVALGWLDHFVEVLFTGAVILLAVTVADNMLPEDSLWRFAGLFAAVAVASAVSVAFVTAVQFRSSVYPEPAFLAGDVLRATILGALLTLIHALQKRNARHARRLQEIEIDRVSLNRRMLEAQLQVMQAQIEPHFLFNTLATVKRLYRTEPLGGERMLESLKHYLRAALPQMRGAGTTLGKEFELARAYLEVLQIRMGERLRFSASLPAELVDAEFPSMMLITLVENAIKHGLNPSPVGGTITLQAQRRGDTLCVSVIDTGMGFQSSSGSGVGLANIRSRLLALYGPRAKLALEPTGATGVTATIEIVRAELANFAWKAP